MLMSSAFPAAVCPLCSESEVGDCRCCGRGSDIFEWLFTGDIGTLLLEESCSEPAMNWLGRVVELGFGFPNPGGLTMNW